MGWATYLTTTLEYNRKTYNNYYDVENDLDEINDMIKYYEQCIKNIAIITEPKKFCEEDEDPLSYIQNKTNEYLEELKNCYIDRYKLNILLSVWNDCHDKDGNTIQMPDNISLTSSYLEGDFIQTNKKEQE